jgi:hypothetical protein
MRNRNLLLARKLAREGFVVIPLLRDAKRPAVRWKRFQTERPTDAELVEWFSDTDHEPAIVTGELSGITVIDCDTREAAETWPAPSPIRQTTKRGMHFVFRWNGERNTVAIGGVRGVDRRGEGGYVVAHPECVHWTRDRIDGCEVAPPIACEAGTVFEEAEASERSPRASSGKREQWDATTGEECVWDESRKAWRHDYVDGGRLCSFWIDAETGDLASV